MMPLSDVDIGDVEGKLVAAAMSDRWISGTGPFVRRFEEQLASRVGRAHVVAVANGTLALELALRALEVGPGDEVIVPALTFAAPAMSVLAVGATPVIVDVTAETWTLSPAAVARGITPRTKAIIAVDVLGHPADYDELARFGLPVIEDAAQAHGSGYKGRPTGSLGVISTFSFHANKTITTGEGGAVCTDSAALADRMRTMTNHGMRPERPYHHESLGRNFRMTNLTAAVGVGQLRRWDELVEHRRRIARLYAERLAGTAGAGRPVAPWADWVCWLYVVSVAHQEPVVRHLRAHGIDARAIWPSLSRQPALAEWSAECPVAERLAQRTILLPTWSRMRESEVSFVAETLAAALDMVPAE